MENHELKLYTIFSYLGPFWALGMLSPMRQNNFLRFHANQGLLLFIFETAFIVIIRWLAGLIHLPAVSGILWTLLAAISVMLSVRGMLCAMRDETKELPVIGVFTIIHERRP